MAAPASLSALLDSLTQSLTSASETAPKVGSIEQSTNGISLLDVKNELLLSYLQNLVFLILLKLRNAKNASPDAADPTQEVVKKLVELRLYIEKGVRPLEDKLRYQIEKILRAADDTERAAQVQDVKAEVGNNSDSESESGSDEEEGAAAEASAGNFTARPGGFVRPAAASAAAASAKKDGVYRPPRVAPTVMPSERRERKDRRPQKSATMDEFIEAEMSSVPMAVPSIGTNVLAGGRKIKTAAERKDEDERREYEESNFTRLPTASKKDKAKAMQQNSRGRMQFGGEEWRDLREGVDRINRLTAKKEGARGTRALLEKSRKRGRETTDGPKSDGMAAGMGDRFQKRLKVVEGGRRDRGGNRK
ncbi:Sas10/Utp3/C1D family protein [Plectosphaerella plurivora]|uniref:Sas10/Utp3/C1D family protein n=1 Tax=Plectosphaerella plurivora TaxID=936078 RepID=A0A9P8V273_9PEZI|nr:Sas10/Utp3/C1D family protein [Plectosphaerella plurivora]